MKILFALLIATTSFAATLDEQIAAANAEAKAASVLAQKLGSQKAAAYIDSLFQLDATLAASNVRVVGGGVDSVWVKVALDGLTDLNARLVRVSLTEAQIGFEAVGSDTLYMRRDRAEKALPVISAVLAE